LKRDFSTIKEQVAESIRQSVLGGRWTGAIPGRKQLAEQLGVNHKTVQAALRLLEEEGLIRSQGRGKGREVVRRAVADQKILKIEILLYEKGDAQRADLLELMRMLHAAGHTAWFSKESLVDLHRDVVRLERHVGRADADAWVVVAGGKPILEWFAAYEKPAFSLYGQSMSVPIAAAAPVIDDAVAELVEHLFELGHRRIVGWVREERRRPALSRSERKFIDHLESLGIPTGPYHLPDWEESPEGLKRGLASLFHKTPPTALIIDDAALILAVVFHLGNMGLSVPRDVSVACTDHSPMFDWCHPSVTHIAPNLPRCVRKATEWANEISKGRKCQPKTYTQGKLMMGGTTGPVGGSRKP
jgi:DNA-binding transcriptional regulator YhcF (GntR family)